MRMRMRTGTCCLIFACVLASDVGDSSRTLCMTYRPGQPKTVHVCNSWNIGSQHQRCSARRASGSSNHLENTPVDSHVRESTDKAKRNICNCMHASSARTSYKCRCRHRACSGPCLICTACTQLLRHATKLKFSVFCFLWSYAVPYQLGFPHRLDLPAPMNRTRQK